METKEKVEKALRDHFRVDYLDLDDKENIGGVMVSPDFEGVDRLERQRRIDRALRDRAAKLTRGEQRRVVLIAAFTPDEYGPIGPDEEGEDLAEDHAGNGNGACECFPDLLPKVDRILRGRFRIDHLELVEDHGVWGVMASPDFDDLSIDQRGDLLDRTFRDPDSGLSDRERRRIYIMPWTTDGYRAKLELDSLG